MIASIQPILSSFAFGTADKINIRLISDNLSTEAQFFFQLGKMVVTREAADAVTGDDGNVTTPAITEELGFKGDDHAVGNVTLSGADYSAWNGGNDTIAALVIAKIPGLTPGK